MTACIGNNLRHHRGIDFALAAGIERKLLDLGAFDAAEKMAQRIPQREIDGDVLAARLDNAWLAGDDKAAFQAWFEAATRRWTSGAHEDDYDESFAHFSERVAASLAALAARVPPTGTAVVLTSGGPVAWAAASLLAEDTPVRTDLWLRLNPVSVNTGVSTLVVGSRGTTLVSFNAHDHLSPALITYR